MAEFQVCTIRALPEITAILAPNLVVPLARSSNLGQGSPEPIMPPWGL